MSETGSERVFLMAEDSPSDAAIITAMLDQAFGREYSIVCVDRFSKILSALASNQFEAIILDMGLPDQSGIKNVTDLTQRCPDLPIVVLTGQDDIDVAVKALNEGAQDYLTKNNISPEILSRSLFYAKERKKIEIKLRNAIDQAEYLNFQLKGQIDHDVLTFLPNRKYLEDMACKTIKRAVRNEKKIALLFFDLDGFKKINDTFGHQFGDTLLVKFSKRIRRTARDTDLVARLSGDEFVLLTDLIQEESDVYALIKRLNLALGKPFVIGVNEINVSCSIGVSFYPNASDFATMLKQADMAMYEAKEKENQHVCFYRDEIEEKFTWLQKVESELGKAIENNELYVEFQPILSVKNSRYRGVEALIRWASPELGIVPPDLFVPIAESTPAINGITRKVVEYSSELYKQCAYEGVILDYISINISSAQISVVGFIPMFLNWLKSSGLPLDVVGVELTEHHAIKDKEFFSQQLVLLKKEGISVSMDDFGCGYSTIENLIHLDLDQLKIDRSLMSYIDKKKKNRALAAGIIEMAHQLNITIVAEGIERNNEFDLAAELGCEFVQGYLISKPMPLSGIKNFFCAELEKLED